MSVIRTLKTTCKLKSRLGTQTRQNFIKSTQLQRN
jgi:hypothetical protein